MEHLETDSAPQRTGWVAYDKFFIGGRGENAMPPRGQVTTPCVQEILTIIHKMCAPVESIVSEKCKSR